MDDAIGGTDAPGERPRKHLVRSFDEDLNHLQSLITRMGGLAERHVAEAVQSIIERDDERAGGVIAGDPEVDALEEEIDQTAIRLFATRQPMAVDLRMIAMALKLSNDLERVSDYAKGIAKRARRLNEQPQLKPFITLPVMAEEVQEMLKDVLDAFVERNAAKAMEVWRRDEHVDAFYDQLFRELITYILEDPRKTSVCIDLLFIAKNIERIGDHATNIAEKIHYVVHGVQINRKRNGEEEQG